MKVENKGSASAPNYELDLTDAAKGSLKKADTAMQKFKVATVAAKGGTASAGEEVGNGETLTFKAGDNVSIAQQGKEITINATGTRRKQSRSRFRQPYFRSRHRHSNRPLQSWH